MQILKVITIILIISSCGKNPFQQTKDVDNRVMYRSALTADDQDFILKDIYSLTLVCDVLNKAEFVYMTRNNDSYSVYISDGANKEEVNLVDEEDNIIMGNLYNLFYDENNNEYLESRDSIEVDGEFFKLEIVDQTNSLRVINLIKINDDFSSTFVEKKYELVNCKNHYPTKPGANKVL